MRRALSFNYILLATALVFSTLTVLKPSVATLQPTKRALLIGMSDYSYFDSERERLGDDPNPHGFPFCDLDGERDVDAFAKLLKTKYGKTGAVPGSWQIEELKSPAQRPTRDAIVNAFEHLIAVTRPGDIVVVLYSGHGSQRPAPTNRVTNAIDTIVPEDYRLSEVNEIDGPTIHQWLTAIAAKHPRSLTVIFDSCHSESADRGAGAMTSKGLSLKRYNQYLAEHAPNIIVAAVPRSEADQSSLLESESAGYVFIAACSSDESANEGGNPAMGLLTTALVGALRQSGPEMTYRALYDKLLGEFESTFQSIQTPHIYGDLDQTVFGGSAAPVVSYTPITVDGTNVRLGAGSLLNVTAGSVYALYPNGALSHSASNVLGTATVKSVPQPTAYSAQLDVALKPGVSLASLQGAQAVETAHDYGSMPVTADRDSLQHALGGSCQNIIDQLTGKGMVKFVSSNDRPFIVFKPAQGGGSTSGNVDLIRADGLPTARVSVDKLAATLTGIAQYRFAVSLGTQTAVKPILIRIRAVDAKPDPNVKILYHFKHFKGNVGTVVHNGDYFVFQVKNLTDQPEFLTLLDLRPRGQVAPVWPSKGAHPDEELLQIQPGTGWQTLWRDDATNASDNDVRLLANATKGEYIEAIATDRFVDFSSFTSDTAARGSDGPVDPLDQLLGSACTGTRGADVPVDLHSWGAALCPICVSP